MTLSIRKLLLATSGVVFVAGPALADPDTILLTDAITSGSWVGGPYTAANPSNNVQDEPDCALVPDSCDDMLLTITLPPGYVSANPTHVLTVTVSWSPSTGNDIDVYFQDPGTGLSVHEAAATSSHPETAVIALADGTTQIRVRCLMYSVVNTTFNGTVTIGPPAGDLPHEGIYVTSTDEWSCNAHLIGPSDVVNGTTFDHSDDAEPAMMYDPNGRAYYGGIAGIPAGNGFWYSDDDCAQGATFLGAVDRGIGGGDIDIATATSTNLLGNYNVYTSSLSLANITMSMSCDGGNTFVATPISVPSSPVDRQWNAAHGSNICYMSYRFGATSPGNFLEVVRLTYPDCSAQPVILGPIVIWDAAGANDPTWSRQLGNMATDRREHADNLLLMAGPNGEGAVYHGYSQNNASTGRGEVWVANSKDFGVTWTNVRAWEGPVGTFYETIFTWVSVDQDGNVWTTFSDGANCYYSVSTDQGTTWSTAVRVNAGGQSRTAIFPLVSGGAGGRATFSFLGHGGLGTSDPAADWKIFAVKTEDGLAATPTLAEAIVSNRSFHTGEICLGGLGCSCCREMLECYDMDINPVTGRATIVYGRGPGGSWITTQLNGTNNLDGTQLADLTGACPNPADSCTAVVTCALTPPCECPGCQLVTDLDAEDVPPVPDASLNIQSIGLAEPHINGFDPVGGDVLVMTIIVQELDTANLTPSTFWRFWFNAPDGQRYWARVRNCATGGLQGDYGFQGETGTTTVGALDHFTVDNNGVICMWLDKTKINSPVAGDVLTGIDADSDAFIEDGTCNPLLFPPVDNTNSAQYTLKGNENPECGVIGLDVSQFSARLRGAGVEVSWTGSKVDRFFEVRVYRSHTANGPWTEVHSVVAPKNGEYSFVDRPDTDGRVYYKLVGVDRNGREVELGLTALGRMVVHEFDLQLAGPNPFRGRTAVSYALPRREHVRVDVYNVAGQVVRTLVDREEAPGKYVVPFDGLSENGKAIGAGVYLVRIHAGGFERTVRVVALD